MKYAVRGAALHWPGYSASAFLPGCPSRDGGSNDFRYKRLLFYLQILQKE